MFYLQFIYIIITSILFSNEEFENYDADDFYSVTMFYPKILKINEGDLLFYGEEGNILRTYDNGITWEQEYTGTKDEIKKLINYKSNIVGITDSGNFMVSEDNGDFWKYYKLASIFSDIYNDNDELYISSLSDTVYYSKKGWNNFEKIQTNIDSIKNIFVINNSIVINTINNKLFYSNSIYNDFSKLEIPIEFNKIKIRNQNLYIYNEFEICKLNQNLNWERYDFNNYLENYVFIEKNNEIIIFSQNCQIDTFGLNIYSYDKTNKEIKFLNNYNDENLEVFNVEKFKYSKNYSDYFTVDVEFSENSFILSNFSKTILKSNDLIKWEILSNNVLNSNLNSYLYDNDLMYYIKEDKSTLLTSLNSGKTFNILENILYDTIDNEKVNLNINYFIIKNKNNGLILYEKKGKTDKGKIKETKTKFAILKDNKLVKLETKIPDYYRNNENSYSIYDFYGNYFLINITERIDSNHKKNKFDSLFKINYFKLNEDKTIILDSIFTNFEYPHLVIDNKLVWIYGTNYSHDSNTPAKTTLYKSIDSCKTINKVIEIEGTTVIILRDSINNFYFFQKDSIKVYDRIFNYKFSIKTNTYLLPEKLSSFYIENQSFLNDIEFFDGTFLTIYRSRSYLDSNYNIISYEDLYETNRIYKYSKNNDYQIYTTEEGNYPNRFKRIHIPIKSKYREFYLSNISKYSEIFSIIPFPNPIFNKLQVEINFPNNIADIYNANFELIKINTGEIINLQIIDLNKINQSKIIYEINVERVPSGVYLLNVKIGENKISKLVYLN